MQVRESAFRHMIGNLGYDVEGKPLPKLAKYANNLDSLLTKEASPLTETDDMNLRDEVLEANERGEVVELLPEEADDQEKPVATHTPAVAVVETLPAGETPVVVSNGESTTVATEKKARKPRAKKEKKEKKPQQSIFGLGAMHIVHWLGWENFTVKDAAAALASFGVAFGEVTLRTYLCDGRRVDEKHGKRPVLTEEQANQLLAFRTELRSAKTKKNEQTAA